MNAVADLIRDSRPAPGPAWMTPREERPPTIATAARLGDLDTSHPTVALAVSAARRWAERMKSDEERSPSLILSGPNGTGKTHIARAILWSMTTVAVDSDGSALPGSRRPRGRFYHAGELLAALGPDEELGGALPGVGHVIGSAPVVIIDDVGAEGTLAYVKGEYQEHERQMRYFRVIDWAYGNGVPLVLTTNLSLQAMAAHVGPRAWDRLMQMAPAGQMVDMSGVPSWRVKAGGR